jgi:alpha-1,6-mannosyltransferase
LLIRFIALCIISGGVVVYVAALSGGAVSQQLNATAVLVAVLSGLSLWVYLDPRFKKITLRHCIGLAIVLGLLGIGCNPLLEDDHFRYLWDGYVLATRGQVYALPPETFFGNSLVSPAMHSILNGVSHPDLNTIYGPLMQAIFALCYLIAPAQLWPLKIMLLGVVILTLGQLHKMGCKPQWLLLLVINPLVVKETTLSAHPDALIGLIFLSAVHLWRHKAYSSAVVLVSCSVAVKLSCLVLLPLFLFTQQGRLQIALLVASATTLLVIYLPTLALAGGTELPGLVAFGQRWVFNPLIYRLIEPFFSAQQARLLTAVMFVGAYAGAALTWIHRLKQANANSPKRPVIPALPVLVMLIALSPLNNPWYWLWVLPLAALASNRLIWLLAGTSLLSYAHVAGAQFSVPAWATAIQLAVLCWWLYWCLSHEFVPTRESF